MIQNPWLSHPLTEEQVRDVFMITLEDDTEDKPWMVMGDLQFWSAAGFAYSLRTYARARGLPWYVASMHPIVYSWQGSAVKRQLAPDVYVAFVPNHPRTSYDVEIEGGFPPFVLEVVSPSSSARDRIDKRTAYDALGVQEYALFTPQEDGASSLEGYQRTPDGRFGPWERDDQGRLWSEVLGLFLEVQGSFLQAVTTGGQPLMTPDQTDAAWRQAERERDAEVQARREAEAELRRLREELGRG
jgi:Uma2 family endonuclease